MGMEIDAARVRWVAFDADDTLWVNEPFFFEAERALEVLLAPFTEEQEGDFRDALYRREMANLKLFGYGAKGFTLSMIETAIELSNSKISAGEIQEIIDLGKKVMHIPIELLEEVEVTVKALSVKYPLMVITKGDLFDQEGKLARSGLGALFSDVEIVSEKNVDTYRQICERYDREPGEGLMVGNSLKSDILPALDAGMQAAHIPHEVTWIHEQVTPPADAEYATLSRIGELARILL